ncbi:hypothetical protein K458DRAFT_390991 [Lentithecium fluviatile CBS 122367]|uniref:Uncharacterized protein n=1 Tax=Lentithecium fluviatile CBS 122367 TaxID=1168545 RepID=A0A6G1IWL9_9PLEO|nr:hypothetical protein K458DRAFT_390991 [Lentithecium fluviatile CBS 122367]
MTPVEQEALVRFCYYHGHDEPSLPPHPPRKNKREDLQPTMIELRDVLSEYTNGASFDDVNGSERAELLEIFSGPSFDCETKDRLMQQMLGNYGNAINLPTEEQQAFLGQLGDDSPEPHQVQLHPRQLQNDTEPTEDYEKGFLEQQIYAIFPTLTSPDGFPMGEFIADLEGGSNSTLETALLRLRARLEAYTAKLRQCSAKVQEYAQALKKFLDQKVSDERDTKAKGKRQTSWGPTGNPKLEAYLQHKHDGTMETWRYNLPSKDQRNTLHMFVMKATVCALGSPNTADSKHESSNLDRIPDSSLDAEGFDMFAPSRPPLSPPNFVTAKPPTKYYFDLISPKWMENIRNLAFKAISHSDVLFPVLYVKLLRTSLRKNWKYLSNDACKAILALLKQPLPIEEVVLRVDGGRFGQWFEYPDGDTDSGDEGYTPWNYKNLSDSSEITKHESNDVESLGKDDEAEALNTGFDNLADSLESPTAPRYEVEEGKSDPFGVTQSRGDGVEDSFDDAGSVPRLEEPYADSDAEEQPEDGDTDGDIIDEVYGIDDYMHNPFPGEVEIPAHADENAVADERRKGYMDAMQNKGIGWKDLNDVWGSGEENRG